MKIKLLFLALLCSYLNFGQESRTSIKGRLLYRNSNVIAANVVNNSAQLNTITNGEGEFEIPVRVGDELIFSSVQYKIRTVKVTAEMIKKNRIVVSINERVNILDEVVVGPENQQKFLDMKKEEFKRVDYTQDKSTKLINRAADDRQLANGLNFVNVAKLLGRLLSKNKGDSEKKLIPSEVLPYLFETAFFNQDLGLNAEQTEGFLMEMDRVLPTQKLFKKDMEFQLIDYLVKASQEYKTQIR
ncbi:carboxypeptidase-like regulatory domain-containing protein [Flavobacteriaceae bacterium]|nr:carboxypeptidase-like regulatory domain-containing protein [Flavobacteriaceae bacterium]